MRGSTLHVIIWQGEQRTPNTPLSHPTLLMRGSTLLLSYAKGSRGLLITPAHPSTPPYEGFYYNVIICQGEQRTINHPGPPHPLMRGSNILLSYAKGSRGLLITRSPPPPPPLMRGSTLPLSYANGSRGLLITAVHPPTYEGFYSPVIIFQGEQRTINNPSPPPHPPL